MPCRHSHLVYVNERFCESLTQYQELLSVVRRFPVKCQGVTEGGFAVFDCHEMLVGQSHQASQFSFVQRCHMGLAVCVDSEYLLGILGSHGANSDHLKPNGEIVSVCLRAGENRVLRCDDLPLPASRKSVSITPGRWQSSADGF